MRENLLIDKSIAFAARIIKLRIVLKETAETEYWLRLLITSEYISEAMGDSMRKDCLELKRLLIASINTAKSNTK